MKIFVEKSAFLKALSHGQSIVEKKTTVPILSHVLLKAEGDTLHLTTTDLDMSLQEAIPAKVDSSGEICVQANVIFDIVRKLSERSLIELEANPDNNQVVIKSGRSRFELSYLLSEDFPQLAQTDLTHTFVFSAAKLKKMIEQTEGSMSIDEARYNVCGVFLHSVVKNGATLLRAVSTDYHRMALVEFPAPQGAESIPEVIVGRKAILDMKKLLDVAEENVQLGLSENRIELVIQKDGYKGVFSSRLIEGTFPDYQSALEENHDKTLLVPREDFVKAVDRVGTVVSQKVRAIKVILKNNQAQLSVVSPELGSALEEMDVDFPYDDAVELCVNVKYLLDVAQTITEDEVEFFITNADSPVIVKGINNTQSTFVLMPLGVD